MKPVLLPITVIILLLVCGCSQPQTVSPPPTGTPAATLITPRESPTVATATATAAPTKIDSVSANTIVIQNMAYDPATLTVTKGAIVRWVNQDDTPHTVTFTKESGLACGTGLLSPSQSCSVKFDTAGTFDYSCAIHRSMHGTIVVK